MRGSTPRAAPIVPKESEHARSFLRRHRATLIELLEHEIRQRKRLLAAGTRATGVRLNVRNRRSGVNPSPLEASEYRLVEIPLGVVQGREISVALDYSRFEPPLPFCHLGAELVVRIPGSRRRPAKCDLCLLNYFGTKRELLLTSWCTFCADAVMPDPCIHDRLMRIFPIDKWHRSE